jgi:hypothetical protein
MTPQAIARAMRWARVRALNFMYGGLAARHMQRDLFTLTAVGDGVEDGDFATG